MSKEVSTMNVRLGLQVFITSVAFGLFIAACGSGGTTGTSTTTVASVAPTAPAATMNDITNLITLGAGVDGTTLEVSVDGGAYAAFNAATVYSGDHTVKVRVKAVGGTPAGADTTLNVTEVAFDTITAPAPVAPGETKTFTYYRKKFKPKLS